MKTNKHSILTLALTGLFGLAISALAEPSQADLMKQATVTRKQAEKTALAKAPGGKIKSAEIENEHHALVWSFDIVKPGSKDVTEVLVDAKTGKIVEVSTETPKDQAKESAADKKND